MMGLDEQIEILNARKNAAETPVSRWLSDPLVRRVFLTPPSDAASVDFDELRRRENPVVMASR